MAWKKDAGTDTPLEEDIRIISPTEAEKCLGVPKDWPRSDDADIDTRASKNRRRNAIGNAFAVPVITRILLALCMCLETPKASAMIMWQDPCLTAPFYLDVLDDIIPQAMVFAHECVDLTAEFDSYMTQIGKDSLDQTLELKAG